jgi:pyruvate,water dikinase
MTLVLPLSSDVATNAARFGAKAGRLAALLRAGLPVPEGFCVDAEAYRLEIAHLRLGRAACGVFAAEDRAQARRHALDIKLGLMEGALEPRVAQALAEVWRAVKKPCVVRSSALVEDSADASFAGQFQSYLGIDNEQDFFTAIRACWAALWSTRALRYFATHEFDPACTAMAILVQPLIAARAAGGGLSRTAEGDMLVNAASGLGAQVAQGEVVPDSYRLDRTGRLKESALGRKYHAVGCIHGRQMLSRTFLRAPCLDEDELAAIALIMLKAEPLSRGPVEIEWALDDSGVKLLQARPLHIGRAHVPDEIWLQHPRLNGHPSGAGWGTGRARVVSCECELERVAPGDVLITTVAGPALSEMLPRVSGVVAELGGSTSHLASLARERGIPMVLGVRDATERIPDGAMVAVDGVAGIVRWMHA